MMYTKVTIVSEPEKRRCGRSRPFTLLGHGDLHRWEWTAFSYCDVYGKLLGGWSGDEWVGELGGESNHAGLCRASVKFQVDEVAYSG